MFKQRLTALAAFCLLLLSALVPPAARAAEPPDLVTARPALRYITLSGFTRARAETPLVAETAGRVEAVFLDIGDQVGEEGRFAQLDDTFVRLDLEENAVERERLTAQIKYDRRELGRYRELALQNNTSASQLDLLERSLQDNRHALRRLEVRGRILEERLARTSIRAPAGWLITGRRIEPGQWVKEGETLGSAADFSTLLVPFALTPEQYAALHAEDTDGLSLELTDQGRPVAARLYRVNPGFDPETRKIAVELALADEVRPARGGLRTSLRLQLPELSGAVSLPAAALHHSYDEYWLTRENGERLAVLLLGPDRTDRDRVRVSAPALRAGDRFRLGRGL